MTSAADGTRRGRSRLKHTRPTALAAGLLLVPFVVGCRPADPPATLGFEGTVMGTTYSVTIALPATGGDHSGASRAVAQALTAVDDEMTTYRPSPVTRFNGMHSTEPLPLGTATLEVLQVALDIANRTGGAFDITIGPLVTAWGFGPIEVVGAPGAEALAEARRRIGYQALTLDTSRGHVAKAVPDLEIDLSGVAKGYAVDRAAAALDQLDYDSYLVELGGEVRARGLNARGAAWTLGIERPDAERGVVQRVVPLADLAMATSGDYRNYRELDGQRISHILDPRTAAPIDHRVASATVLHPRCAMADAIATAMVVLGEDEALEIAEREQWAVLLLVRAEGSFVEHASSAFDRLVAPPQKP